MNLQQKHVLLFPNCFLPHPKINFTFTLAFILSSANAFNFDQSIILLFGKELKDGYFKHVKAFEGNKIYFVPSGRISRNSGENIFRSYTGTTSENTDFHVLVARASQPDGNMTDVIYLTFLVLDVIL